MPAAGAPHLNEHRVCDFRIKASVLPRLKVLRRAGPVIMIERLRNLPLSDPCQNRSIQHQLSQVFRILTRKESGGHSSPAPPEQVDLVLSGFVRDQFHRRPDVLSRISRIRHQTVLDFFRLTVPGDVQPPDRIPFARQPAHQTIILIINIKLM